jgi:hypothetical protein
MSSILKNYEIMRFVRDLHKNASLRKQLRSEPLKVIEKYKLSDEQKEALINKDYLKLYKLGVHPLILFNICHIVEGNPDVFREQVVPKLKLDKTPTDG